MLRFPLMLAVLFSTALFSGCVSQKVEPDHQPKLGISQSGDGVLTIQLPTEAGYKYSILYQDPKDMKWKILDGCDTIVGDGEVVEIQRRINPRKPVPQLTVQYSKIN